MALIHNVEGPKGSGKSVLARGLALNQSTLANKETVVRHFTGNRVIDDSTFDEIEARPDIDWFFDRGILSFNAYGWVNDAYLRLDPVQGFSTLTLQTWSPLTRKHFEKLFNTMEGYYVVMYASDTQTLIDRITKRHIEENKGATPEEFEALHMSNLYFKHFGQFLESLYPEKVITIDTEKIAYSQIAKLASLLNSASIDEVRHLVRNDHFA